MELLTDPQVLAPLLVLVVLLTATMAGTWAVFEKAGRRGWAALVPLYNLVVLHQAAGKPVWWVLFYLFCPGINTIFLLIVLFGLATRFGKGFGFFLGLLLFPFLFLPLLGFGKASYQLAA